MDDYDDVVRDSVSGIKKKRTQRRVSKFNIEDGLLYDIEESKVYVPGEGIGHIRRINEKLLSCGHSAGIGIGHIAECGHAPCALCVERSVLECAEPDCFRKLCTVPKCICSVHYVDGVFYCKEHAIKKKILSFFSFLFLGRTSNENRISEIRNEYYSRRLQLRVKNETQGK